MNFKEALIAHLNGEKVEVKRIEHQCAPWVEWSNSTVLSDIPANEIASHLNASLLEFRLSQRTITVNGVEVPAPESVAPKQGVFVYVSDPTSNNHHFCVKWVDCNEQCSAYLERGLVYLNKEDAIARAKAMLLHE